MPDVRTYFKSIVIEYAPQLMREFDLNVEDAAAIFGNLGHESGGFRSLQEKKPMIAGSRGGYGWAQWTGPRRKQYEQFCEDNDVEPASNDANFAFLCWELRNTEKTAIPRTKKARGLENKMKAFELGFERAGVKHYPSRLTWSKLALAALQGSIAKPVMASIAAGLDDQKEVIAHTAEPPHNQQSAEIGWVQKRLIKAGYHEVGLVDDKWGSGTAAAIAGYKNDRHLEGPFVIDEVLLADLKALPDDYKRPIAMVRAEVTGVDLAHGTADVPKNEVVYQSRWTRFWAKVGGWFTLPVVGLGALSEAFDNVKEKLSSTYETVSSYTPNLLQKWWFWLGFITAGCFMLWRSSKKIETTQITAYKERKLLS